MVNEPFLNLALTLQKVVVTHLVQARNLLTHFLLLESIAHASSRRQQQRTCSLVVALTFRSWPQVSFFPSTEGGRVYERKSVERQSFIFRLNFPFSFTLTFSS